MDHAHAKPGGDAVALAVSDTFTITVGEPHADSERNTLADAECVSYADADSYADRVSESDAERNADRLALTDADTLGLSQPYAVRVTIADAHANGISHRVAHFEPDPLTICDAHANGKTANTYAGDDAVARDLPSAAPDRHKGAALAFKTSDRSG